jgi:hypothetical protein
MVDDTKYHMSQKIMQMKKYLRQTTRHMKGTKQLFEHAIHTLYRVPCCYRNTEECKTIKYAITVT